MRILRWCLVALMTLYGLSQVFAAGSTLAAKAGWFHNAQLALLATIISWPRMVLWLGVGLASFVSAWMLARRDGRTPVVFGAAVAAAALNLVINEASPVYARVFDAAERRVDWYMLAALVVILALSLWIARGDRRQA